MERVRDGTGPISLRLAISLVIACLLLSPIPSEASFGSTLATPQKIRDYYGVSRLIQSGYKGVGVTVAVVAHGIDATFFDDIQGFDIKYGLPDANITIVRPFGSNGTNLESPESDESAFESTADAEMVHAMAPGARIAMVLVGDNGNRTVLDGFSFVIDNEFADIAITSFSIPYYGSRASDVAESYNDEYAKSVGKNITLITGSGDSGANSTIPPSSYGGTWWTEYLPEAYLMPDFSPYFTVVGGTEFKRSGTLFTGETGWNMSSGGPSNVFAKPAWQVAPGVPEDGYRDIPDVALLASCETPWGIFFRGDAYRSCGTSLSGPIFAGIVADIEQAAGHRLGFLNPFLYSLAASDPSVFIDVTSGNSLVEFGSSIGVGYCAHPGWDFVTGLGRPDAVKLLQYLAPEATLSDAAVTDSTSSSNGGYGQSASSQNVAECHPLQKQSNLKLVFLVTIAIGFLGGALLANPLQKQSDLSIVLLDGIAIAFLVAMVVSAVVLFRKK